MSPFTPATPFTAFEVPVLPTHPLARAASAGDVAAVQGALKSVAPRVRRAVAGVLGRSHPELEDVIQHALLAFIQALPSFRGECEPDGFAARIAARVAIDAAKRARAARARRDDAALPDALPASEGAPEGEAAAARRTAIVRDLLTRIPVEQAEAMALRFMLGWSLEEIAAAMQVPRNTVRSRLGLAKKALRAAIERDPVLSEELGG
ncbi:MAG: RNA polymerase sigma factor [Myxococcales bacterium]|nr:RNA polymerase sigma factor [Myxococcales bacterium]